MGVLVKEKLQLQQQQQQQGGGSVMLKDQARCRRGGRGGGGGGVGSTTFVQLELAGEPPLPCGWEKCLDLQVCVCVCVCCSVLDQFPICLLETWCSFHVADFVFFLGCSCCWKIAASCMVSSMQQSGLESR